MIFGTVLKCAGAFIAVVGLFCALELAAKGVTVEQKHTAYTAALLSAAGLIVCALGEIIRVLHRIASTAERRVNLEGARMMQETEKS